jgi:hypothetical protein
MRNCFSGLHTHAKPSQWPVRHLLENRFGHLKFVPVYESSIATAVRAMVIEGYGVAWIPKSIVADDLEKGRLVRAAEENAEIPLDIKIYRYEAGFSRTHTLVTGSVGSPGLSANIQLSGCRARTKQNLCPLASVPIIAQSG